MTCSDRESKKKIRHRRMRDQKGEAAGGGGCRLPEEIIYEILVRAPTMDALLRCRTVCKLWNSIVMTSAFVRSHLKSRLTLTQSNTTKDDLLVSFSYRNDEFFFLDSDNNRREYTKHRRVIPARQLTSSMKHLEESYSLLPGGSCNGLICLHYYRIRGRETGEQVSIMVLWNPCVRRLLALPSPSLSPRYALDMYAIGFCELAYDSVANDFKVVYIVGPSPQDEDGKTQRLFQVYSVHRGSWRSIDAPRDFRPMFWDRVSLELNGALHWVCGLPPYWETNDGTTIVTFSVATESFGRIKIPEALIKDSPCYKAKYRESFALISRRSRAERSVYDMWVMEEYGIAESWTKLLSIRMPDSPTRIQYDLSKPKYFRKSTGQVILATYSNGVTTIDLHGDRVKVILDGRLNIELIAPFVETLALLDRGDAFSY